MSDRTRIGVAGVRDGATVATWGDVEVGGRVLRWHVAGDDRWHVPESEPSVRQQRLEGTPVVETRIKVPDGDVVHTAWAVPDHGGLVVVEVANESPLPVAVAFSGAPLLTHRPWSDTTVQGIDLPSDARVFPIGHRARIRVATPIRRQSPDVAVDVGSLASADAVVRGWRMTVDRASVLDVPDRLAGVEVARRRCDLVLAGPTDPTDAVGYVLDAAELARLGDEAGGLLVDLVPVLERLLRWRQANEGRAEAMLGALRTAVAAGDDRAAGDIERELDRCVQEAGAPAPIDPRADDPSAGRFVRSVESGIVEPAWRRPAGRRPALGTAESAVLLRSGVPTSWLGAPILVERVPTGRRSTLSFAVRWHGERPAVLWEQHGKPVVLASPCAPGWTSDAPAGETLWPAPTSS